MAHKHPKSKPTPPPVPTVPSGALRRVGVEVEFANVTVLQAAKLVQQEFGGTYTPDSEHRVAVEGTRFGNFTVELDAQIVHKTLGLDPENSDLQEIESRARDILGHALAVVVPAEIVSPPIPWYELDQLTPLIDALRDNDAEGTEAAPVYGFGLHLNPEVAEETADFALRHLQAYAILEDWLREAIQIDPTRKLFPHIDPFPDDYKARILDPNYAPTLKSLIRDYVRDNPTRNRGLDMMPLFRHLDAETLLADLQDASLIKARPTFHYRLPNASLADTSWNAVVEWNRWVKVEELAANATLLGERKAAYHDWLQKPRVERWLETIKTWFAT